MWYRITIRYKNGKVQSGIRDIDDDSIHRVERRVLETLKKSRDLNVVAHVDITPLPETHAEVVSIKEGKRRNRKSSLPVRQDFMNKFGIEKMFDIEIDGQKIRVEEYHDGKNIYFGVFILGLDIFVITRATDFKGKRFWTSIPEGHQEKAEKIGKLIEGHIKKTL
ncbi:MAG: hypothetical protein Q8918_05555 [Bacteroidota bacterium]|nr:hypothetical protein [Bacteroidota bacterium]